MKKKRKLKPIVYIVIIGLCLLIVISLNLFNDKKPTKNKTNNNIDYVKSIMNYDLDINVDVDFLKWIDKNYPKALQQINKSLENKTYNNSIFHQVTGKSYFVLQDLYHDKYRDNNHVEVVEGNKKTMRIGYAGDVSLADNWYIMPKYKNYGGINGILSTEMIKYMKKLDFFVVNNEFAFSNRGSAIKGKLYTFKASPDNVKIYHEMGVDLVTLANNHVYDFGKLAFEDTLTTLENASIPYIGAGRTKEEAMQEFYLIINGYKVAFLNATRAEKYILTPEATETEGGVFRCYNPTLFANKIKEVKEQSDYVVALIHWGTEDTHELETVQQETGKLYIDSGADMVIGTHAHVLQGVEFYKGKLIAYNLGNFIFNDLTLDTGILTWKLDNNGNSKFYFLPGIQKDCTTSILSQEDQKQLLEDMTSWSINATFLADGQIIETK